MRPRLTIAIPTVNRADLLPRAIESALAQTSSEIEILVSDNGSTDDTPAVIARYANRGIRTFRNDSTISAAKHGAFLMSQAQGEFFLGLSDDDFLEPQFAERVLQHFEQHPELSFVYTGCAVYYEDVAVPALVAKRKIPWVSVRLNCGMFTPYPNNPSSPWPPIAPCFSLLFKPSAQNAVPPMPNCRNGEEMHDDLPVWTSLPCYARKQHNKPPQSSPSPSKSLFRDSFRPLLLRKNVETPALGL